jgi:TolB-like protein
MSLIAELRRRNVFRVGVAYAIVAWLLVEVASVFLPALRLPEWTLTFLVFLVVVGFPLALIFAWAFELTPEGIKREAEVDRAESITHLTGRKLDFAIIGLLAIAVVFLVVDNYVLESEPEQAEVIAEQTSVAELVEREKSVAVLPFVNMSADPENVYFADGLSEELLNRLAQVPDLRVTGRTSSFQFKGENRDLREIGEMLGVAHVLEGSVRRQGNQVRITAQLVASSDGSHLWSQTYDRTLDDVFAIQDEIADEVVGALDIVLDEEARLRMQQAGVRNVDAFMAFQRGNEAYYRAHGEVDDLLAELAGAMVHYDEAIRLEPNFAAAHLYRSDYYVHMLFPPESEPGGHSAALTALRDSLDRAFESARDPQRKAIIDIDRVLLSEDWGSLRQTIERAMAFDGCVASNWGLQVSSMLGYAAEANPYWNTLVACEPLQHLAWQNLGYNYLYMGDTKQALASARHALDTLGEQTWSRWLEQSALLALGRHSEATETALRVPPDTGDSTGILMRVMSAAASGRIDEAREWAEALPSNQFDSEMILLAVSAMLGDREAANQIAASLDARIGGSHVLIAALHTCICGPLFDMKVAPNFAARIAESGVPWPPPTLITYPAKDW